MNTKMGEQYFDVTLLTCKANKIVSHDHFEFPTLPYVSAKRTKMQKLLVFRRDLLCNLSKHLNINAVSPVEDRSLIDELIA